MKAPLEPPAPSESELERVETARGQDDSCEFDRRSIAVRFDRPGDAEGGAASDLGDTDDLTGLVFRCECRVRGSPKAEWSPDGDLPAMIVGVELLHS